MFTIYWQDEYGTPGCCGECCGTESAVRQLYLALRKIDGVRFTVVSPGFKACFPGSPQWWRGPYINPLLAAATPINGVSHWRKDE